jgi:hypothetical protein
MGLSLLFGHCEWTSELCATVWYMQLFLVTHVACILLIVFDWYIYRDRSCGKKKKPVLNFWQVEKMYLFSRVCRPAWGPTQHCIQWVLGVEWLGYEGDYFSPSSA